LDKLGEHVEISPLERKELGHELILIWDLLIFVLSVSQKYI
jgi:hypothetical protein